MGRRYIAIPLSHGRCRLVIIRLIQETAARMDAVPELAGARSYGMSG